MNKITSKTESNASTICNTSNINNANVTSNANAAHIISTAAGTATISTTISTPLPPSAVPTPKQQESWGHQDFIIKRIGNTTYKVAVYFSGTSTEQMADKILRLAKCDAIFTQGNLNAAKGNLNTAKGVAGQ